MTDVRNAFVALALACAACGGGDAAGDAGADAGLPPRLEIVAPGDQLGLAPGDAAELRVRYTTGDGAPIGDAPVTFALLAGEGGAGGSSLSAATVPSDAGGEAAVTFLAGASGFDLRVTAEAPGARATFYVTVSAGGFAALDVVPGYAGARPAGEHERIELRLYRSPPLACDELDADEPPASPLAPRAVDAWGEATGWPSVSADEAYALLVWGVHAVSGAAVSVACVDVPATALPPGRVTLELAVPDRPLALAAQALATTLDLAPLDAALDARGAHRPWRILGCPAGRGQLLLDWLVDALSGDGALDGTTAQPTGIGALLHAQRGALEAGCRAATRGAGPSLDARLDGALTGGPFPGGATLATLLARRDAALDALVVRSALAPVDADAPAAVVHELVEASLAGLAAPPVALAATDRPVVAAVAAIGAPVPGPLAIGSHGYTLRAGSLLRGAFEAAALAPAGLAGQAATLGAALAASARDGEAAGCAAVSRLVCGAVGQPATCAEAACGAAAFALDGAMAAWWRHADGTGLDLVWSGAATLADADGDLAADPVPAGAWAGALTLVDGTPVEVTGTFASPVP